MEELKWDANGLIPVVVQDERTKDVVMVAYMNQEAFDLTLKTKKAHYYSRSRRKIWLKGETSGHFQEVKSIRLDCDNDTLLLLVDQKVAACHTGYWSCFYRAWDNDGRWLARRYLTRRRSIRMTRRMARKLALAFVTCGYVGYLPLAPGTWASILGCILLYLLPGILNHPLTVILIAAAATLCINRMELPEKDPGYIVVDELAGICVAMVGQGLGI